jgi:hypothetical protein
MSAIQKFMTFLLPKRLADDMRTQSQAWQICCSKCNFSRSVWDSGGIRWATRAGKTWTLMRCSNCKTVRVATVKRKTEPT